jgi:hypothetical protein
MSRKRITVEQRWHRLRAIEGAADLLMDFGLTAEAWPEAISAVLRGAGSE